MGLLSGVGDLEAIAARASRLAAESRVVVGEGIEEGIGSNAALSRQVTDLQMAERGNPGAAKRSAPPTGAEATSNIRVGPATAKEDTLVEAILANPVLDELPQRYRAVTAQAMSIHARALAEPFAADARAQEVLAHHFGMRATAPEVHFVLKNVADHGGVDEAAGSIKDFVHTVMLDQANVDLRLGPGVSIDSSTGLFTGKFRSPLDQAILNNPALNDMALNNPDAVRTGLAVWARTVAHPLAGSAESADVIARRLAATATKLDIHAIGAVIDSSDTVEEGLQTITDMAKFDRNLSRFSTNPDSVPNATERDGYWVNGHGYSETHSAFSGSPEDSLEGTAQMQAARTVGIEMNPLNKAIASNATIMDLPVIERHEAIGAVQAKIDTMGSIMGVDPRFRGVLTQYFGPRLSPDDVRFAMREGAPKLNENLRLMSERQAQTDRIAHAGLAPTAEVRAASLNEALIDLQHIRPWEGPEALQGLVAYSRALAKPLITEGTSENLLVGQIALHASPKDLERIMEVMGRAKSETEGVQQVEAMAKSDIAAMLEGRTPAASGSHLTPEVIKAQLSDRMNPAAQTNPAILSLSSRERGAAMYATSTFVDALVQPIAKDAGSAEALKHYMASTMTADDVALTTDLLTHAGDVGAGEARVREHAGMLIAAYPKFEGADAVLKAANIPTEPLFRAAAANPVLEVLPEKQHPAVILGLAQYGRTFADELAKAGPAKEFLAGQIASQMSEAKVGRMLAHIDKGDDQGAGLLNVRQMALTDVANLRIRALGEDATRPSADVVSLFGRTAGDTRRNLIVGALPDDVVTRLRSSRMDAAHDHLNALLDPPPEPGYVYVQGHGYEPAEPAQRATDLSH